MTLAFFLSCWTVATMTDITDHLDVLPGNQVRQSMTVHIDEGGKPHDIIVPFLLFIPKQYAHSDDSFPLLLFLHGLGESGDGGDELNRVKINGPTKFVDDRLDFPFILVSPQCPKPGESDEEIFSAWKPEQLIQLIDYVQRGLRVDPARVYVTGLSMGGFGTWRLAATYPDRIAAAVPICGGGDPVAMAKPLAKVPIWCFHGAKDDVVPPARSQQMVDAVKAAGGDIRFTLYPDANHNAWSATYDNPEVYDWLLTHRKSQ